MSEAQRDAPLRRGWTTGACASGAARAAFEALLTGAFPDPVPVALPKGLRPEFALATQELSETFACAGIVKDAGDDPDVAHGALIMASVRFAPKGAGISFMAGDGVGTVTRPGLPLPPGEPAINPAPRAMIRANLAEVAERIGVGCDAIVEIAVPGGEKLAERTANGRLGIVGGLSILGTTGVVTPYSCSACKAIVDADLVLQLDDPGLPDTWDMANPEPSVDDYKKFAMVRVEALNHALRGLPEDRIRYHICWGSWHGPHTTDLPLRNIVDVLLKVRVGAYSIEAGNVRHEHEWKIWRDVKLPDGKVLVPGVVSHATNVVEHPEVVADRILNFARVVGRENVIAGTDCGLGGRIHPQLVWAKLAALVEGAKLATKELYGS